MSSSNVATGFPTDASAFFNVVRAHTIQGTFCDPYYGGNANFAGWDLIGYPGVRLAVTQDEQRPQCPAVADAHVRLRLPDVFRQSSRTRGAGAGRRPSWRLSSQKTDVVIVGLGAVGGVAALPLVAGGTGRRWPRGGIVAAHRGLRARRVAKQLSWLAAVGAEGQPRDPDASAECLGAVFATSDDSSDDECRRRHLASLLGTELAAEPVGLQGRQRDDAALRRLSNPQGIDRRGLAVRARGTRAVLRPRRTRNRRLRKGRQHQRPHRSRREHFRRSARARVSDAAAARVRLHRHDGGRRARKLGWHAFPGPAAINSRNYQNRTGCVYHGFCSRGGCHVNAKGSTAVTTIPKAVNTKRLSVVTEAHVIRVDVNDNGRVTGVSYLKGGTEYFQPADVVLLASYTYENVRLLLLSKSKAFPNGLSNNHGQVGRHYFSHNTGASCSALFPAIAEQLVRSARPGRRRRQLGGRQLRPCRPGLHRRRKSLGLLRPAADWRREHEHLRQGTTVGLGMEGVHQGERRPREHRLSSEDDVAVRGQLPRSRSGRERSPGLSRVPHHRRVQGQRTRRSPRSSRTRWPSGIGRPAPSPPRRGPSGRWDPPLTHTAARAWATTPRRTWSTGGDFRTRSPTSVCSGRR